MWPKTMPSRLWLWPGRDCNVSSYWWFSCDQRDVFATMRGARLLGSGKWPVCPLSSVPAKRYTSLPPVVRWRAETVRRRLCTSETMSTMSPAVSRRLHRTGSDLYFIPIRHHKTYSIVPCSVRTSFIFLFLNWQEYDEIRLSLNSACCLVVCCFIV